MDYGIEIFSLSKIYKQSIITQILLIEEIIKEMKDFFEEIEDLFGVLSHD